MSDTEKPAKKRVTKKRRKRRSKGKKRKLYFTPDTQAAIVEHQQSEDIEEMDKIYRERIHPAFDKLVENLINMHKFAGQYDSREDLRNDCVAFLYETINKFDNSRGTNAFSYFNIVAKRWLIIRSKKRVQNQRRNVSMADKSGLSRFDNEMIEEHAVVPSQDEAVALAQKNGTIIEMMRTIKCRLKNENEIVCIDSIINLFEMSDQLDLLNKSAVLTYLREMTGMNQKQLTMTMHSIKRHYRELRGDDRFDIFSGL